jgi:hypothetical protein
MRASKETSMRDGTRRRRLLMAALLAAAGMAAPASSAQSAFSIDPGTFANAMAVPSMVERLERSHRILFGTPAAGADEARATTTVVPRDPRRSIVPALAEAYPGPARPQAQQLFRELLAGYAQLERQFGLPRGDAAGAVAAFLTGNYIAFSGRPVPDEHFKPLADQLRASIAANPHFVNASAAEKQQMFEHLAIVGMFMATTFLALQQQPDPALTARLREAGRRQLEHFRGVPAERVTLGAQGLVIR